MATPKLMDEIRLAEALLYIMNKPVSTTEIAEIIQTSDEEVKNVIQTLREIYQVTNRPYEIVQEGDHYLLKLQSKVVGKIKQSDLVKTSEVPKHLIGLAAYIAFHEFVKKEPLTVAELVKKRGKSSTDQVEALEKAGLILTHPAGKTKSIKVSKRFMTLFNLPADNPEEVGKFLREKIYEYAEKIFSGG